MTDSFYLCSHTHWDREWYGSYQQFRMRLVRMLDELLDILGKDSGYRSFNLDGQTVVLEDYLEIRPEKEPVLKERIQEGLLLVGPWYILPDEFLVTGEATVRNLIFGARVGNRFGKVSNVGYLPDTFGHFSQMPQILRDWGIDTAILWRGLSGDGYTNELLWESPDGTRILLSHIPEEYGYITAALFVGSAPVTLRKELIERGLDPHHIISGEEAVNVLVEACRTVKQKAVTNCHILFNGVDHMTANPEIPNLIRKANQRLDGDILHATFDEYAGALHKAVDGKDLQVVTGDLRDTIWTEGGHGIVINGVLSSRIYLKQQNERCCTLLERWVEPFSVFSGLLGGSCDKAFIDKAWQWVLKNHPHDSIGGCSIDAVHRQMETRFEWAQDIGENLLEFVFTNILEKARVDGLSEGEYTFAVFNPCQERRSEWIRMEIEIPWSVAKETSAENYRGILITDMAGREQKSWLIDYEPAKPVNRPSLRTFATAFNRPVFTVSFWAEDVPACGYKLFKFRPLEKPNCVFGRLIPERNVLENDFIRAEIKANGAIRLKDKITELVYDNLHYFEDGGDNGGGYAYSFPKDDSVYTSLSSAADVAMTENSEARASYRVTLTLNLPESLDSSMQARSGPKRPLVIESIISLGAGSRRLDIETTLINTIKDHRLRVLFPTYLSADTSSGEAQFDVVDHPVKVKQPPLEVWKEDQPKQFAQKAFASITDGKKGLTVADLGLPEYEVTPDTERAVAVTLLRAVSRLSTGWKNTRISAAGPPIETPDAQMLGRKLAFNYSIIPHAGAWHESGVQKEAHAFAVGMRAFPVLYSSGPSGALPEEMSFLSVEGENVVLSSVKPCEDGEDYAVRIWNGSERDSQARLTLFAQPKEVFLSNLREERVQQLPASTYIDVPIGAKKIVTLRIGGLND
ncbi:MAG: hypothetical protein HYX78_03520 [Armatimonadetes bacterium]|nr:hypothetical protein [Armatimonadota bacterium]